MGPRRRLGYDSSFDYSFTVPDGGKKRCCDGNCLANIVGKCYKNNQIVSSTDDDSIIDSYLDKLEPKSVSGERETHESDRRRLQQAHCHNGHDETGERFVIEELQISMVDKTNQTKEELELLQLENSLWYEKAKAVGCGIMFIGAIDVF